MIEQNKPPDKKANKATLPVDDNPIIMANTPSKLNILSVFTALSFAKKNPPICTATQIAKNNISLVENIVPASLFAERTTAKAT